MYRRCDDESQSFRLVAATEFACVPSTVFCFTLNRDFFFYFLWLVPWGAIGKLSKALGYVAFKWE